MKSRFARAARHAIAMAAVALSWCCATASAASNRPDVERFVLEGVPYDVLQKTVVLEGEDARRLLIVHEARTGLTWWVTSPAESKFRPGFPEWLLALPTNVGASTDRLVFFTADVAPPSILMEESRTRFESVAEAERALSSPLMKDRRGLRTAYVNLWGHLDNKFRIPLGGGHVPRPITIPRVCRTENNQWLVTLRGPNGDFADVTLTDEYELVHVRRYR